MPVYNVEAYLAESIESLTEQTIGFEKNVQLILVNDGSPDGSERICKDYAQKYPDNIIYVYQENAGVSAARNKGIEYVRGEYINFLDSDDKWEKDAFKNAYKFLKHNKDIVVASAPMQQFEAVDRPHILNNKFKKGNRAARITDEEEFKSIQLHVTSAFFKADEVINSDIRFDSRVKYGEDSLFLNSFVIKSGRIGLIETAHHLYRKRADQSSAVQTQKYNREYYSVSPRLHYGGLVALSMQVYGEVIPYVQNLLAHDISWRVYQPVPDAIKADAELYSSYCSLLREYLSYVDDKMILKSPTHKKMNIKRTLIALKSGEELLDNTVFKAKKKAYYYGKTRLIRLEKNKHILTVNIFDIADGFLTVEGTMLKWIVDACPERKKTFYLFEGERKFRIELEENGVTSESNFFGKRENLYYFRKRIRLEKLFDKKKKLSLYFGLKIGKHVCRIPIGYGKFVSNKEAFAPSYKFFGNLYTKCSSEAITVKSLGAQEKKMKILLGELKCYNFLKRKGLDELASVRMRYCKYKLTHPSEEKIWLISDRAENAGDNGEVFFKYVSAHKPDKVRPIFVISKNALCVERLQSEGEVMFLEDEDYPLYFLLADKIISSSANDFTMNPFGGQRRYMVDLYSFRYYYLQHGVACADLSSWLHKHNKNLYRIFTSSERERQAFLDLPYHYTQPQIVTAGQARFDDLKGGKEKLVLVLPTWRRAIKESYDVNTTSVYFDGFKDTEYFRYYNSLINDERLLACMRKHGYKGLFCLHPIHMKQAQDYQSNDVFSVNEGYVDYNDVFARAALTVTDYSSVLFDFAYLRKAVVYTQFDKEEFFADQIYDEGYFSYEKDGFGPVCYDYESTVDAIIAAVERDCENEEKYISRADDFFAFDDRENSRRILEAIAPQTKKADE